MTMTTMEKRPRTPNYDNCNDELRRTKTTMATMTNGDRRTATNDDNCNDATTTTTTNEDNKSHRRAKSNDDERRRTTQVTAANTTTDQRRHGDVALRGNYDNCVITRILRIITHKKVIYHCIYTLSASSSLPSFVVVVVSDDATML